MIKITSCEPVVLPWIAPIASREVTLSVTRNGRSTDDYKEAYLWDSIDGMQTLVSIPINDGVQGGMSFPAAIIDGKRAIFLRDFTIDLYATFRNLVISSDIHLKIDLNDGSGGSVEPAEPAVSQARIRVDRLPSSRDVVAMELKADGTWRSAGTTRINDTGMLELQVTGGDVYVMAADDYGAPFQPNLRIDVGATIRPSHFQGWLYRCTEAGQLPADEPDWWPEQGDNPARLVGTARLQAVRYYQPIAHGPIKYELV